MSMKTLKTEVAQVLKIVFADDSFIRAFLDSSGINKKPDYQKEISENMKELTQLLSNQSNLKEK